MNPTPTNCRNSCPTKDELKGLVDGGLSDDQVQACIAHLDECGNCQQAIQDTAVGDSTFPELVEHIDRLRPPKQSAYWSVVDSAEKSLSDSPFATTVISVGTQRPSEPV